MIISAEVLEEIRLFANSVVLGAALTFLYDGFRIMRNVFKHSIFWISVEDMLYWIATAIFIFISLQKENNGVLRWFIVGGAAIGMFLYKSSVSRFYVKYTSNTALHLVVYIKKTAYFVLKPFKVVKKCLKSSFSQVNNGMKKVTIILKNRLTVCIKWFTIALCKHNGENGDLHNDEEV